MTEETETEEVPKKGNFWDQIKHEGMAEKRLSKMLSERRKRKVLLDVEEKKEFMRLLQLSIDLTETSKYD